MIKAWLDLWKNIFCYTGTVSRKEYWLALAANVIFMYLCVIPCALIVKCFTDDWLSFTVVYLIVVHLPVFSLYVRRARGAGWGIGGTLFYALVLPVISGLAVGILSSVPVSRGRSIAARLFAISFALFFYGGVLGILINDDPVSIPALPMAGLALASATLIGYGVKNRREVLAFFTASNGQ